MSTSGQIVEVIGAVVDVEFPQGSVPKVYDALHCKEMDLVFEVQQQLGDGVVRTIAMGTTELMKPMPIYGLPHTIGELKQYIFSGIASPDLIKYKQISTHPITPNHPGIISDTPYSVPAFP